jgi:ubiquinone/menaquinone biosynthesis C-methylase UbiE
MQDMIVLRESIGGSFTRPLVAEILGLVRAEGIAGLMAMLSPFTMDRLCDELETAFGYMLRGNRRRMISVLLALLEEAGWCVREGNRWRVAPVDGASPGFPDRSADRSAGTDPSTGDDQLRFFLECLKSVPTYLRGGSAAFGFEGESVDAWDRFLGSAELRCCRKLLLELMGVRNSRTYHLLDLCYGPGWGLAEAATRYPSIRITAVDFTEVFAEAARDRLRSIEEISRAAGRTGTDVVWCGPGQWRGFGHPLPFREESFDAVFFSGGDPYIPRPLRRYVYGDIARVLSPGGRLGILTRGFPDRGRRFVPSPGMRMASLVHDFAESVCEGWQGFTEPEENLRMFREIGYRGGGAIPGEMCFLESSLWVLRKGDRSA